MAPAAPWLAPVVPRLAPVAFRLAAFPIGWLPPCCAAVSWLFPSVGCPCFLPVGRLLSLVWPPLRFVWLRFPSLWSVLSCSAGYNPPLPSLGLPLPLSASRAPPVLSFSLHLSLPVLFTMQNGAFRLAKSTVLPFNIYRFAIQFSPFCYPSVPQPLTASFPSVFRF